jgi:zinc transporter 1
MFRSRGIGSADFQLVHPASFRNEIIAAAYRNEDSNDQEPGFAEDPLSTAENDGSSSPNERSTLLPTPSPTALSQRLPKKSPDHRHDSWHAAHNHAKPKDANTGGSGHGDLNMRGAFLHVMGDALGNIGVIASALIIWLTSFSWRYYADPAISLIITVIILASAIPLCRAASRILLQAVPSGMSVDEIREDIEQLPGVISCHDLHVWQLSATKLIASLHIKVNCQASGGQGSASYMHVAKQVEKCIREYGIDSSTIRPEFFLPDEDNVDCVAMPAQNK